jgi:hypothetical protein
MQFLQIHQPKPQEGPPRPRFTLEKRIKSQFSNEKEFSGKARVIE